jgi:Tol biopolymer transport system component
MSRIAQFTCIFLISAASIAAPKPGGSGTRAPALGYTATGGRGLGLKLANEDGSGVAEVYRFTNGSRFDLSSAADRRILIVDNARVLLTSWNVGSRGITALTPAIIYGGPARSTAAAFSQDGTKIAFGTDDNYVTIVNTNNPMQQVVRFSTEYPFQINWMPDGNSIVIATQDSTSPYAYRLVEYPITGGTGSTLFTAANINDFDTSRVPGDRSVLVSYSNGPVTSIGVWDGAHMINIPRQGAAVQGAHVSWNCAQTRITLKNFADESVYTMDANSGAKQLIYKGVQGRWPRYMKCDTASLMINARQRGGRLRRY